MKKIVSSGIGMTVGGIVALSVQGANAQAINNQQTETGNNPQVEIADVNNPNSQEYRDKVTQATWEILNQSNYKEILAKYGIPEEYFIVRGSTLIASPEVKSNLTAKGKEYQLLTTIKATPQDGFIESEKIQQATLEILNQSNYSEILQKYNIPEESFIMKSFLVSSREVKENLIAKKIQAPDFIIPSTLIDTDTSFGGCLFCYVDDFGNTVCVPCPCPC